jgi:hypothetical protein
MGQRTGRDRCRCRGAAAWWCRSYVAQSAGGADFDVEHDRQGEGEVTGHLNDASDRCQRHLGGGGEHRAMLMAGGTADILPSGRHPATGNEG